MGILCYGILKFISGFGLTIGSENFVYLKSGGSETVNFMFDTGNNVAFAASLNTGLNLASYGSVNSLSKTGNLGISSTIMTTNSLDFGTYLLTMTLSNAENNVQKKVVIYYEEEILNFKFYLQISVASIYIPINEEVTFETSMTSGSNVQLEWFLDGNGTCLIEYVGQHRQSSKNHTFTVPGIYNVTVVAVNTVSRTFHNVPVSVQYRVHGFDVHLAEGPHNTSQNVDITVFLNQSANIEMGNVSAYVDYGNGFSNTYILPSLASVQTSNFIINYQYPVQGNFTVNVKIQNEIDFQTFSFNVFIWDQITAVLVSSITKIKVNELTTFSFQTPPHAGFNYEIFYGDGNSVSDKSSGILYQDFNVQPWTHSFSAPKIYSVSFTGWNQYYIVTQEFKLIVQHPIPSMSLTPSANEIPLPDGVQVFDMSMVTNNPSPTNVSCDFDSGFDVEKDVETDIDFGIHLIKTYNYTQNGTYHVLFYCRNEVSAVNLSSTMIIRNFTLPDFIIHYNIVNGMNMTDINTDPYGEMKPTDVPVIVPFRISLFGVTRLPPDITFIWDFGDGTPFETVLISDFYKYHEYKNRGTYKITINMTGPNETHQIDLHIQMGVIKFVSDKLKGQINVDEFTFTASGVIGGTYSFDLLEGNIATVNSNPASAKAKYLTWGRKHAMVTGRNSTFIETVYADPVSPDYVMLNMYYKYNDSVHYPPGDITVIIGVNHTSHIFPNISCDIFMNDFVEPGNEIRTQNVSYMMELVFNYQYRTIGEHTRVTINCTNVISYDYFTTLILVKNDCFKITGVFDRHYSLKTNPMIAYISDDVDLRNRMPVLCPDKGPRYDWTVETLDIIDENTFTLEPFNKSLPEVPTGSLRFHAGEMPEGLYKVSLNVSLPEPPFPTWIYEYTYVRFTKPRPYASVVGGNRRTSKLGIITINAWEESYDTEVGYGFRDTLFFSWYCFR
ncbi:hypothetical protein KUTeg_024894 [Tegillarca granosa]|uniref:PKD domain-containing protein n=1 Tax=Tegillarca granosa TaxID=220873 RepID=A0ABQ9E4Y0_TEGGR|nr:hypothetical protein KUTeg_024894 [Tegillarca granosa]